MRPSEHLHYFFFVFMHRIASYSGLEYMVSTYQYSWRTALIFISMVIAYVADAYTLLARDRSQVLRCITLLPVATLASIKYFVFLTKTKQLRAQIVYLRHVYRQCDAHCHEAKRLIAWANITRRVVRFYLIIVFTTAAIFCAMPLYALLWHGDMLLMLPVALPSINEHSIGGWIVMSALEMWFIVSLIMAAITEDVSMFLLIVQMCPLSEILTHKLRTLSAALATYTEGDDGAAHRQRIFLHNILSMHFEFGEYMLRISKLFYVVFLVEMLFDALGMCVILFVLVQEMWLPLYMFWITYAFKALLVCALGTLTEIHADRVRCGLEKFPWFLLPITDQRKFVLAIQRAQNPTVLMCGTVRLNMELFVSVMRNTYSVAMLLVGMSE